MYAIQVYYRDNFIEYNPVIAKDEIRFNGREIMKLNKNKDIDFYTRFKMHIRLNRENILEIKAADMKIQFNMKDILTIQSDRELTYGLCSAPITGQSSSLEAYVDRCEQ